MALVQILLADDGAVDQLTTISVKAVALMAADTVAAVAQAVDEWNGDGRNADGVKINAVIVWHVYASFRLEQPLSNAAVVRQSLPWLAWMPSARLVSAPHRFACILIHPQVPVACVLSALAGP